MVDSMGNHGQPQARSDDRQHVEERRRVAAAAHGDQHRLAALDPALVFQSSEREPDESGRMRAGHVKS